MSTVEILEAPDYFGQTIRKNDIVVFPSSGDFMEAVVEKIVQYEGRPELKEVYVRNGNGYKKWKCNRYLIKKIQTGNE